MNISPLIIGIAHAQEPIPCSDGTMADPYIGCVETPAGIVNPESGLLEIILKFAEVSMNIIVSVSIIVIIFGGIRYAMNMGNEHEAKKAKQIILWSAIGLIGGLLAKYLVEFVLNLVT